MKQYLLNWGSNLLAVALTLFSFRVGTFAQRSEQAERGRSEPRHEPAHPVARAPQSRSPAMASRPNHGTIRHVETHVEQRPVEERRQIGAGHGFVHRDGEIDIGRRQFWHGFVLGQHVGALRGGYRRLLFNGSPYFFDDGIFYLQAGAGYESVYPPIGLMTPELPDGAVEIDAGGQVYYYAGGAFYLLQGNSYVISAPPMGVNVPELPPGAAAVSLNGSAAYQFNGTYYRPVFLNGVTQFTTVLA